MDTNLTDLDFDSRSQKYKKAKKKKKKKKKSGSHLTKFSVSLTLAGVMNLILVLSHPFHIQGTETYLCISLKTATTTTTKQKQQFNVGWYSDIFKPTSFKLSVMTETMQ